MESRGTDSDLIYALQTRWFEMWPGLGEDARSASMGTETH